MSTIITVYGRNAFKEFLLPAINNADTSIILAQNVFHLGKNLEILLEVVDHEWDFLPSDEYRLVCGGCPCFQVKLHDRDVIRLNIANVNQVTMTVRETDSYFSVYEKFCLAGLQTPVTIGKATDNILCGDGYGMVSRRHAVIRAVREGYLVEDLSRNGTFVNNIRIRGSVRLSFGDVVDIFGLRILSLGDFIAVSSSVKINYSILKPCRIRVPAKPSLHVQSTVRFFHRSPRCIPKIDTEPIEIDEAPSPKDPEEPSLAASIGPSLTMALPMALGCSMMMLSSRHSGAGVGIFMYTGLVTALSSSLIGTFWAVYRAKKVREKFSRDKETRLSAYNAYLDRCSVRIREKYEKNARALRERYLSAAECCRFSADQPALWNRNAAQEDFLYERLGIGAVPFQAQIIVPKEKFRMLSDTLLEKPNQIRESCRMLRDVPVCVDLLKNRLIGVIGGQGKCGAITVMNDLIAQIAAGSCYTEVKLLVVYDSREWGHTGTDRFICNLPHVWNESKTFRYVADNKETAGDVFYELIRILRRRAEENSSGKMEKKAVPKPYYVLFLANQEMLEGELLARYVLEPKMQYGLTTVILAGKYEELPNQCETIIENDGDFTGMYNVYDDMQERRKIQFDEISPTQLECLARNIADVAVRENESDADIPNSLTFFDMYHITKPEQLNVPERWKKNNASESMRALIGEKAGGAPCYLDLHEKYHGPHGLVAGTTGSGKSELLQTLILSLSINFSPYDVVFFIIDYKGGGMADLFAGLPHMIGRISNLSGSRINRALISIRSELARRQRIFREYGVNHINKYTGLFRNNEAGLPMPHLFIIIDEFAELKREQPDFMRELIRVSQVGRSLGVNMILSTQKPGGTVDENIWSNSRFHLCLRVQDRQESRDMLHRPDAAYITQAGRCCLQVGNDELFELFQSGWSGAVYSDDPDEGRTDIASLLSITGRAQMEGSQARLQRRRRQKVKWIASMIRVLEQTAEEKGYNLADPDTADFPGSPFCADVFRALEKNGIDYPYSNCNEKRLLDLIVLYRKAGKDKKLTSDEEKAQAVIDASGMYHRKLPGQPERTQLEVLTAYLNHAAKEGGYTCNFQLWMPVLPKTLYLDQLWKPGENVFDGKTWPVPAENWTLAVPVGKYDDPENQDQGAFVLDLARDGNVAVCGLAGSGRSTFLQTYLYALIRRYSPAQINVYAIDCSSKMLSCFEGEAHFGAVMYEGEDEKIEKCMMLLSQILAERKKLFRGGTFSQYLISNGRSSIPAVLLVIDNYSDFRSRTGNRQDGFIMNLSREGIGCGIYLMISAADYSSAEIPIRLAENLRTPVCFEMNDKFGYGDVMRRIHLPIVPESGIRGRGLMCAGETVLEFQAALAAEAETDFGRAEKIRRECRIMNSAWQGRRARPVPMLPEKPSWNEFEKLDEVRKLLSSDRFLPVGYDMKYASVYPLDLSHLYQYLISGRERSGRTNMLKALMLGAHAKGGKVVIFDFDDEFESFALKVSALRITDSRTMFDYFSEFRETIVERNHAKNALLNKGMEEEEIFRSMDVQFEKIYMFIGNLGNFLEHVYSPAQDVPAMHPFVENIMDKGHLHNVYWFACYGAEQRNASGRRAFALYTRDREGIHFGGNTAAQKVLNLDYIPYLQREKQEKPGIGLISMPTEHIKTQKVMIPLVKAG